MRIVACLVWFEESIESLDRCVRSLAGVVDVVVACDGRWRLMPGQSLYSPPEQAAAIRTAAEAVGLDHVVVEAPVSALETQVAKRDFAMQLASEHGKFVFVIDGDEYVEHCDPSALRAALAETDTDVFNASVRNAGHRVFNTRAYARRRGYRSDAGVTVEDAHNGYRAADGRWLSGEHHLAEAADTAALVGLVNDRDSRSVERQKRSGFYFRVRSLLREEGVA